MFTFININIWLYVLIYTHTHTHDHSLDWYIDAMWCLDLSHVCMYDRSVKIQEVFLDFTYKALPFFLTLAPPLLWKHNRVSSSTISLTISKAQTFWWQITLWWISINFPLLYWNWPNSFKSLIYTNLKFMENISILKE